jgi:hypothetical protein
MARSGSYDFSINRDAIINGAFRQIGVLGESQTASTTRISQASQQLNLLIDQWEYQGVGLWLNKEVVLFPAKDQIKYYFGATAISGQSDYACLASEYTKTELSAAVTASGTTYTVDSITGFTNGDYIGLELDDGSIHWTTINGVPAGSSIVVTAGPASAAAIDRHVYGFTNVVQRPLEVIRAFRRNHTSVDYIDTPIEVVSIDEYMDLTSKTSEGPPNLVAVDMQLDDIILHLWPEPENMKEVIHLWVKWPIQDFDATADDWDFPRGWGNAIKLNLAVQLAPEYGRKVSPELMQNAQIAFGMAQGADLELAPIQISPNVRSYKQR